jgi:soluble cytochrome b562
MEVSADKAGDALRAQIQAFHEAREAGDAELMATAALGMPAGQRFGVHPGQVPALVHEAYTVAGSSLSRCRLAAALARAWVYGGDADRAVAFAAEAVDLAEGLGDPDVLADALDAALLVRWGPDDFEQRLRLAARLAEAAAHLADPEMRLSAHLWRLTTAWECLDVVAVQRQLRALEALAGESGAPRPTFFAVSRRATQALVADDLDLADRLIVRTREVGSEVAEPDVDAVVHSLVAARARQVGDVDTVRNEAVAFEQYGAAEGIPSVSAEAAVLWLEGGEPGRASDLLHQLAGAGLAAILRDVDFLLTVTSLVRVATVLRLDDIAAEGAELLDPYAGRAVLNAGAVTFHGVVDDYLYQAHRALGHGAAVRWRHAAASGYRRIGARWWESQLGGPAVDAPTAASVIVHLHPDTPEVWSVGREGATGALPDLKGLHYLRHLAQRPGVEVGALQLSAAVAGHARVVLPDSDAGEVVDDQALAMYRDRLREIDGDLDEAESWADQGRVERLRREREALLDEVSSATGLAGRRRRVGSTNERARVAVRKAIAATLDRVERQDPALGRLLRDTVTTGTTCRYDPDPARPVTWVFDRSGR